MWKTLKQIASVGIVTESRPVASEELRLREHLQTKILATLGRALCVRQVDAGSCNGCELEIHALNNAFYNIEGLGIRFAVPGCPPSPNRILAGILTAITPASGVASR